MDASDDTGEFLAGSRLDLVNSANASLLSFYPVEELIFCRTQTSAVSYFTLSKNGTWLLKYIEKSLVIKEVISGEPFKEIASLILISLLGHKHLVKCVTSRRAVPNLTPATYETFFMVIMDEYGEAFIAMEKVEGVTLKCMLEGSDLPLSDDHKTIIITGIGETLAFFERYGIQHWDLHTGNVMVNRNTSEPTIVDFGAVGLTTADKRRLSNENSSSAPNLPDIQAFYSIVREMFVDFRREEGPSPPSTLKEIVELVLFGKRKRLTTWHKSH
ncbi:hypothetical protein HKX48_007977 [Thoreauomyces humboldtii]|nr:hypothetical protein HKX48_007977 [Thoreauomyces humboldtii]